jgi:twitching motility protein PilT
MRDIDSIQIALTMAETGHLVFATLHTNDAPQAIDRIIDVFPAWRQEQTRVQLAASLSAIIAQRLIPRIDGGLVAAYEVLIATHPVRNLIREGRSNQLQNVMFTNTQEGMQTLESSLAKLIVEGVITYEDAMATTAHPKELVRTLEQLDKTFVKV